ncbi:MAG: hypothetical protein ACRCX2_04575 [Paraclostridium sp.]
MSGFITLYQGYIQMRLLQPTTGAWYQPYYKVDLIIEGKYYRLVYFPDHRFNKLFIHPINPHIVKLNL